MKRLSSILLLIFSLSLAACSSTQPTEIVELEVEEVAFATAITRAVTPTAEEEFVVESNSPVMLPQVADSAGGQTSPVATPLMEDKDAKGENYKTEVAGDVAVIYHRSGGIAGVDEQWIIYTDGGIESPDGRRQVGPQQVQELLDTIKAAGFFDLDDSYLPMNTCCDRFIYDITVQLDGQVKTVNTIDASPTQPDQLTTALDAIEALLFTS